MNPSAPFFPFPAAASAAAPAAHSPAALHHPLQLHHQSPPQQHQQQQQQQQYQPHPQAHSLHHPQPQPQHPYHFHPPPQFVPAPNHSPLAPQNYTHYFHNAASPYSHDPALLQQPPQYWPPPSIIPGLAHSQQPLPTSPSNVPAASGLQAVPVSHPASPPQVYPFASQVEQTNSQATVVQDQSDKEDGEVSDMDTARVPSAAPVSPRPRPPSGPRNQGQRRDASRGTLHGKSSQANSRHDNAGKVSAPERRTAYESYKPKASGTRKRKSPDYSPMVNSSTSTPPNASKPHSLPIAPKEADGITHEYLARERAKAKAFILAWHRSGFTYDQLVAEELDPELLKILYDELRIDINLRPSTTNVKSSLQSNGLQPETRRTQNIRAESANAPLVPNPLNMSNPLPNTSPHQIGVPKSLEKASKPILPAKPPSPKSAPTAYEPVAKPAKAIELPEKPIYTNLSATPQPQTASRAVENTSLLPPSKASQAAPVDRQSYIARLMAAKSKKSSSEKGDATTSAPVESTDRNTESPLAHAVPVPSSEPEIAKGPTAKVAASNNQRTVELSAPRSDSPLAEVTAAAKRKAQTELARKRMEALTSARLKAAQTSTEASLTLPRSPSYRPAPTSEQEVVRSNTSVAATAEPNNDETDEEGLYSSRRSDKTSNSSENQMPEMIQEDESGAEQEQTLSRSQSRIPGLFMSAPSTSGDSGLPYVLSTKEPMSRDPHFLTASFNFSAAPATVRKRPVASDFNDDFQYYPVAKRAFGHVRGGDDDESMIIEVSDDENAPSEDNDALDEDPPKDGNMTDVFSTAASTPIKSTRSLAPQSQTPNNPTLTLRNDPANQTSHQSVQPPIDRRDKDYLKHQKEILAMKLKIAKLEQKRKVKSQSTNVTAPGTPGSELRTVVQGSPHLGDKIAEISREASVSSASAQSDPQSTAPEQSNEILQEPVNDSSTILLPVRDSPSRNLASTTTTEDKSIRDLEWKNRRRTEIQSGIPALEASFADDTRQLEILKEQMRRIEEDMRRKQEDKERLTKELESLGIDTEGMAHSDLQATKDELTARMDEGDANNASTPSVADSNQSSESSMSISSPEETTAITQRNALAHRVEPESANSESEFDEDSGDSNPPDASNLADEPLRDTTMEDQGTLPDQTHSDQTASAASSELEPNDGVNVPSTGPSLSTEVVENTPPAQSPHSPNEPLSVSEQAKGDHSEDELSDGEIPESGSDKVDDTAHRSPVLRSDMEDYAPPDSAFVSTAPSIQDPSVSVPENEEYEPTEIDTTPEHQEEQPVAQIASDASGEYEPPNAEGEEDDADYITKESGDEYDPDLDYEPPTIPSHPTTNASNDAHPSISETVQQELSGSTHHANMTDKVATEQKFQSDSNKPYPDPQQSTSEQLDEDRFVPYESALKTFKNFRFHPEFPNAVSGGFRSNTYTHSIDPQQPWCPFEAAGGVCNDEKCEGQHFRSMRIKDDDMVRQVGLSNPGQTPEEQSDFTEGLKIVLLDLKQQNIDDPEAVAAEIAAYRRRFIKDPTRVL